MVSLSPKYLLMTLKMIPDYKKPNSVFLNMLCLLM